MSTKAERIQYLHMQILKAKVDYYGEGTSVSDQVFDAWVDELRELDPNNSLLKTIGAPVSATTEWKKATHSIPMGSLDKVNTPEELTKWARIVPRNSKIFVAEKLDGISIEIIYESGKFVQAITRGDGLIGEDISKNVKRMSGVLLTLPSRFNGSLRGEIIMTKTNHARYFPEKANPRNAASGTAKRLDGVNVDKLDVIFYKAIGNFDFDTMQNEFEWLNKNNLRTPNYWVFSSVKEVNELWRKYQDVDRAKLNYEIDGLVVSVDDMEAHSELGDKDMRPVGSIAFKFDNEAKESTIKDIIWQVGNSGRVTPVAVIDPVTLVGAKVTRASLYNPAYINELKLDIGARVLVVRANDVIPRIEELIKGTGKVAKPPSSCPSCSRPLKMSGENLLCTNYECPEQVIGRIKNWIKELNILEWGETTIAKLVQSRKVKSIADLYDLSVGDIMQIDRMGQKSAEKLHELLWNNIEIPLHVFIGALSIPMIGSDIVKTVMNAGYDTLEKLRDVSTTNLESIPGIGAIRAKSLTDGIDNNEDLIEAILANGVRIKKKVVGSLTGKSVCFTSAEIPMKHKRAQLEQWAIEAGADVKSSVGKTLSYLVITDPKSTSSKAVAARKFGVKMITEDEFLRMVDHEND